MNAKKLIPNNEISQAIDTVLMLMIKHGILIQNLDDPDMFDKVDMPKHIKNQKMKLVMNELKLLTESNLTCN